MSKIEEALAYAEALEQAHCDFFVCLELFEKNFAEISEWKRTIRAVSIISERHGVEATDLIKMLIPDTR